MKLTRLAIFTLLLSTLNASASSLGNASAGSPHPITAVPDFHCTNSSTDCLEKAHSLIRESLLPLDLAHGSKPDLYGPSDYWGQSEYSAELPHKAPLVAILMHGIYEDGRQLAPEAVWLANLGIPVLNIVLAGHGKTNALAPEIGYQDFLEDAERAFRFALALGDRVLLVGHSTGGILSVYLGIKYPMAVAATVLIEPAVRVTPFVQTAACVAQHGISDIAEFPILLKIYGKDPASLRNRVISPSAGCQVHYLRDAALSLVPAIEAGSSELSNSRALGRELIAPLLIFNNVNDTVVDSKNNDAFAEGASTHGLTRKILINQDHTLPHGSITFSYPERIISELNDFLAANGLLPKN